MLELDWYLKAPIDWEHKHYLLMDWIQQVDLSFRDRVLSPYLLRSEQLLTELRGFGQRQREILQGLERVQIEVRDGVMYWNRVRPETPTWLLDVQEIVEWSIPVLSSKVDLGYAILAKYPQVLW
jgi:hypothetical protein